MDEAVDGRQRHRGVRKDLVPFSEGLIYRNEHGSALVSGADQLEEHAGLGLILGDVSEIVEDQEIAASAKVYFAKLADGLPVCRHCATVRHWRVMPPYIIHPKAADLLSPSVSAATLFKV